MGYNSITKTSSLSNAFHIKGNGQQKYAYVFSNSYIPLQMEPNGVAVTL